MIPGAEMSLPTGRNKSKLQKQIQKKAGLSNIKSFVFLIPFVRKDQTQFCVVY